MDDLTAFLAARIDEREHFAKIARLAQKHREQMLREVEAMRAILARYIAVQAWSYPPGDGDEAVQDELGTVIRHLATIWSGHPGYRPEWKP